MFLPDNFQATERGNSWFTLEDWHVIVVKLDNNNWMKITIKPDNYPGFNIQTFASSEEYLATVLQSEVDGWDVRKCNLPVEIEDGVVKEKELPADENYHA